MARPALSATRSTAIINLLACLPGRPFTLSEIARSVDINVGSCHAVLSALTKSGYLSRSPDQKTYSLGPALIAIGKAARREQPLLARIHDECEKLAAKDNLPVLVFTVVEEDMLAIDAVHSPSGQTTDMDIGQRVPFVPPIGALFLAWSPKPEQEAWLGRTAHIENTETVEDWRHHLELIQERGFQVTLHSPNWKNFANIFSELNADLNALPRRNEIISRFDSYNRQVVHPKSIEPEEKYDVIQISAPIFDPEGNVAYQITFQGFQEPISGAQIQAYAENLMQASISIMRTAIRTPQMPG